MEAKVVEEEAAKRIEELVSKRVEEELEKRKEEIEAEVLRRVEEAKREMEREMMAELELRKQQLIEQEKIREVRIIHNILYLHSSLSLIHHFNFLLPLHKIPLHHSNFPPLPP